MPFDVFISYSAKDKATADAVCARIEAEKVRCWIAPRDVPPGMDWDESIIAGIKSCRVMVLILSSHSNASPEVKREVKLAFKKGLTVMPFRIENVTIGEGLEYYMSSVHWLDALTPPMERHIEKLASLVRAFITAADQTGIATVAPAGPATAPEPFQPVASHPGDIAKKAPAQPGKSPQVFVLALLILAGAVAGWWFGIEHPKREAERQQTTAAAEKPKESDATSAKTGDIGSKVQPANGIGSATKENPFVNSLGMKFVPVPITGGPTDGQKVLFSIWDTRVRDYRAYANANPGVEAFWGSPGYGQGDEHPVVMVSWDDAKAFCAWLTQKERNERGIGANDEYRLPTDHEWSWAVGIGDQEDAGATPVAKNGKIDGVYPWGTQWPPPNGAGNYDPRLKVDDYEHTSAVGSFSANQNGLYDMGGNVWQWCEDGYDGEQPDRVLRGVSWSSYAPANLLSSARNHDTPDMRLIDIGFRCVLVSGQSSP